MASEIERFMGPISSTLQPEADGEWVRHSDHEQALEDASKRAVDAETACSFESERAEKAEQALAEKDREIERLKAAWLKVFEERTAENTKVLGAATAKRQELEEALQRAHDNVGDLAGRLSLAEDRAEKAEQAQAALLERVREALGRCRQGAVSVGAENGSIGVNYGDLLDGDGRTGAAALERAIATGGVDIAVIRLDDVNAALASLEEYVPVQALVKAKAEVERLKEDFEASVQRGKESEHAANRLEKELRDARADVAAS